MKWLKRLGWLLGSLLALVLVLKVAAEIRTAVVFEPRPLRLDAPDLELSTDLTFYTEIASLMNRVAAFPRENSRQSGDDVAGVNLAAQRRTWFAAHQASLASIEQQLIAAGPSQFGQPRVPLSEGIDNLPNYQPLRKAFELLIFELEQGDDIPADQFKRRVLALQNLCELWLCSGEMLGVMLAVNRYDRLLVCLNQFGPEAVPEALVERILNWRDWSQALKFALLREGKKSVDYMRNPVAAFGAEFGFFTFFDFYHAEHTAQLIDRDFQAIVRFDKATGEDLKMHAAHYEKPSFWDFNPVGQILVSIAQPMYRDYVMRAGMVALKGQMEAIRLTSNDEAAYQAKLARAIDPFTLAPFRLDASGRVLVRVTGNSAQNGDGDAAVEAGQWSAAQWGESPYGEAYPGIVLVD